MKSKVSQCVKSGALVTNAAKFYELAATSLSKPASIEGKCLHFTRQFFLVNASQVKRRRADRTAKTLPGTRKLHCVAGLKPGVLRVRRLTCYCHSCMTGVGTSESCDSPHLPWETVYLSREDGRPWPKHILDVDDDENTIMGEQVDMESLNQMLSDIILPAPDLTLINEVSYTFVFSETGEIEVVTQPSGTFQAENGNQTAEMEGQPKKKESQPKNAVQTAEMEGQPEKESQPKNAVQTAEMEGQPETESQPKNAVQTAEMEGQPKNAVQTVEMEGQPKKKESQPKNAVQTVEMEGQPEKESQPKNAVQTVEMEGQPKNAVQTAEMEGQPKKKESQPKNAVQMVEMEGQPEKESQPKNAVQTAEMEGQPKKKESQPKNAVQMVEMEGQPEKESQPKNAVQTAEIEGQPGKKESQPKNADETMEMEAKTAR